MGRTCLRILGDLALCVDGWPRRPILEQIVHNNDQTRGEPVFIALLIVRRR